MEQVTIIGAGVVGTATGYALAEIGHEVSFVDVNEDRVAVLQSEGFRATTSPTPGLSGVVFLSVPTPSKGSGYDFSMIEAATQTLGSALADSEDEVVIVVRSTVTPGFSDRYLRPWIEASSKRRVGESLALISAPEFLRQASASADARTPWMTVVGGHDSRAVQRIEQMFAPLGGERATFDNPTSAELVKIVHNCYNATKISFWNEITSLCNHLGVKQTEIGEVVAKSAEASFNARYGIVGGRPFGGACLPKDLDGLIGFANEETLDVPLLNAVKAVNVAYQQGEA